MEGDAGCGKEAWTGTGRRAQRGMPKRPVWGGQKGGKERGSRARPDHASLPGGKMARKTLFFDGSHHRARSRPALALARHAPSASEWRGCIAVGGRGWVPGRAARGGGGRGARREGAGGGSGLRAARGWDAHDATLSTMTLCREAPGQGRCPGAWREGWESADGRVYITTSAFVIRGKANW